MVDTTNFCIELDNCPGYYFPGQTVMGKVVWTVTEPEEQIRYLQLKFRGPAVANWYTILQTGNTTQMIPHHNQETYFEDLIQLNQKNDGTWMTSFPYGRNSIPFVYHLPVGIPASHNQSNDKARFRIFYQAEAKYRNWTAKSEMKAISFFSVQRPLDLNLFPLAAEPIITGGEKYLCCCCCRYGPISFKFTFNKTGFLIGQPIEFLAELVNNTYKNIEKVEVWISKTVTFTATDKSVYSEIWKEQIGEKFHLPGVSSRQTIQVPISFDMIPRDYEPINSFGCSFMESTHQLNINMVIPCAVNLKGNAPLVIGVVPFLIPPGPKTISQGQSVAPSIMELMNPGS